MSILRKIKIGNILHDIGTVWGKISGSITDQTDLADALSNKVDKVSGKGLSTNDYDNTEKTNVSNNTSARHTHSNKSVLDGIDATKTAEWDEKGTYSKPTGGIPKTDLSSSVQASLSKADSAVQPSAGKGLSEIKTASVSQDGTTLNLTKQDDSTISFQGGGGSSVVIEFLGEDE